MIIYARAAGCKIAGENIKGEFMANTYMQEVIKDVEINGSELMEQRSNRRSVADIKKEMSDIQEILKDVMVEGQHYGNIPGCGEKKCLLKPGAEKLSMTFRLRPIINNVGDIITQPLPNNHINISVFCHIVSHNGSELATGIGSCSTMESKYRYRGGEKKGTGKPVPKEYWNLKKEGKAKEAHALIGGAGFSAGKINGEWQICEIGEKMENPDIADTYNTVLKMAKKRAYVDGILSATCASDIFTQDVEDTTEETGIVDPSKKQISGQAEIPSEAKQEPSISGGAIGMVIGIRKETKTNRTTKAEFVVYHIKLDNNIEYDASGKDAESTMNLANDARKNGLKVTIKTKGDKYNTITAIDIVEPDFSDPDTKTDKYDGVDTQTPYISSENQD